MNKDFFQKNEELLKREKELASEKAKLTTDRFAKEVQLRKEAEAAGKKLTEKALSAELEFLFAGRKADVRRLEAEVSHLRRLCEYLIKTAE